MFGEPARTPYDLRFSIFGFPVRVHPIFWLVALIMGSGGAEKMVDLFGWVAAVFVAILIHELGHAWVMRHYGLRPWIVLYGMGGLACYDTAQLSTARAGTWLRQILISVAGVATGFLVALIVVGFLLAFGGQLAVLAGVETNRVFLFDVKHGLVSGNVPDLRFTGFALYVREVSPESLAGFLGDFLYICLLWGVVNLLPVYPLDGGHISREIFLRLNAREGIRRSLMLSVFTAGSLAAFALATMVRSMRAAQELGQPTGSPFGGASLYLAMLFGYLAYSSYAVLSAYNGSRSR